MSECMTTQPLTSHDAAPQDLIVIAAMFTAALYRECGAIVDPELICTLLNRFHLTPPSTMRETHQCNT